MLTDMFPRLRKARGTKKVQLLRWDYSVVVLSWYVYGYTLL